MKLLARLCLPLILLVIVALPAAAQGGDHRVALVVRYGDGHVQTRCVAFAEPSLTGQQVLERSGLRAIISPNGAIGGALCSLDGQGCAYPAKDCFCKCTGAQCEYWAYFHLVDGAWQYSQMGSAGYEVKDGAVEGWSWGAGNFASGVEPPKMTFAQICSAAAGQAGAPARGASPAANLAQYAGFGAAVIVLVAAALLVLRRRGGRA